MKKALLFVVLVLVCSSFCACNEKENTNTESKELNSEQGEKVVDISILSSFEVEHAVSSGLLANDCSSYKVMEEQADLVVLASKVGEELIVSPYDENRYDLIADMEIDEVIKNHNDKYKVDDKVVVREDIEYSKKSNRIFHYMGYEKMQIGKKYYLLLGYDPMGEEYYFIGAVYGKVPVDEDEQNVIESEEISDEKKEKVKKIVDRNRKKLFKK